MSLLNNANSTNSKVISEKIVSKIDKGDRKDLSREELVDASRSEYDSTMNVLEKQ